MPKPPQATRLSDFTGKEVVCLYGDSGSGKTSFIATQPDTLIIKPPMERTAAVSTPANCDVWDVETHNDLLEVKEWAKHEGDAYDWIWLDTWTLTAQLGLDDVFLMGIDMAKDADQRARRAANNPDQGQYLKNMNLMRQWHWEMAGCGLFNLGITAHTMYHNAKLAPAIPQAGMLDKIAGIGTITAYLEVMDGYRALRLDATDEYMAKFVHNKTDGKEKTKPLPKDPSMTDLIARINDYKTAPKKRKTPPNVAEEK